MARKFITLKDRFEHPAGTTVYVCKGPDYGLCRDDEDSTGLQHEFMTVNSDGSYPGFTIPYDDLKEVPDHV